MSIIDHHSLTTLPALLEQIATKTDDTWGHASIKRSYLNSMTDDALTLAFSRQLQGISVGHIFFTAADRLDFIWSGKQKTVFRQILNMLEASMMKPEFDVPTVSIVQYYNPREDDSALRSLIVVNKPAIKLPELPMSFPDQDDTDDHSDITPSIETVKAQNLTLTPAQIELYSEQAKQKPFRQKFVMLVVEDQPFSQKLLCEILRGTRLSNSRENPVIDSVNSIEEAWKIFVKKAPDVAFIDLCLPDGSGHALAAAIKSLDPMAQTIIVTANNYEEELSIARQNNVDGFIVKPYNKKQILDCLEKYSTNSRNKRISRGTAGAF